MIGIKEQIRIIQKGADEIINLQEVKDNGFAGFD